MKHVLGLIAIAVLMIMSTKNGYGGMLVHKGNIIEGKVIDEDTEKPIKGAHVVAVWRKTANLEGGRGEIIHIAEDITKDNGYFKINKWRKKSFSLLGSKKYPDLTIFKPGYKQKPIGKFGTNDFTYSVYPNSKEYQERKAMYEQGIFKLKKFNGTLREWAHEVSLAESNIVSGADNIEGYKDSIPKVVDTLKEEWKKIKNRKKTQNEKL